MSQIRLDSTLEPEGHEKVRPGFVSNCELDAGKLLYHVWFIDSAIEFL